MGIDRGREEQEDRAKMPCHEDDGRKEMGDGL